MTGTSVGTGTIIDQISHIEAAIHKRGWDKEPELHLLYMNPVGPAGTLAVNQWPAGRYGDVLESLSLGMSSPGGRAFIRAMRQQAPGCYGVVHISEAYASLADQGGMSSDELKAYVSGEDPDPRRLADRVGSVEVRTIGACDLNGNHYVGVRVRGKALGEIRVVPPGGDYAATGRIPEALARILTVVSGQRVATSPLPEWLRGQT